MSNIDKQWLQQKISDMEAACNEIPFGLDEDDSNTLAALRIALASLEAEPVGYFGRFDADDEDLIDQCSHNISGAFPLYTAPPALTRHAASPTSGIEMSAMQQLTPGTPAAPPCFRVPNL